jgi:hypothetical protein
MLQVFWLFQMYVASISSGYCKSRSGVAHVVIEPTCRICLLQLLGHRACTWEVEGWCGKRRGWRAAGARPISAYAGSRAWAIPFVAGSIGRLELNNITCWVRAASGRLLGSGHPDASVSLPKANGVKTLIPSHLSPRTKKIRWTNPSNQT